MKRLDFTGQSAPMLNYNFFFENPAKKIPPKNASKLADE